MGLCTLPLALALALSCAASATHAAGSPCPPGLSHVGNTTAPTSGAGNGGMRKGAGLVVCEDLGQLNGTIGFYAASRGANGSHVLVSSLRKRVYSQAANGTWGGFGEQAVTTAEADIIGNLMVQDEPDYAAVMAAFPPILPGWGENDRWGYAGQHTFTTSRAAGVDLVFDHLGDAGDWSGYPRPANVLGHEHRSGMHVFEGVPVW